jgi:protein translocase SecG subunit
MTLLINILLGIYVFVAVLMMLVILMQRPKSEGLGAAFGGGVTENIFGAQTTNVLTKVTGWLAAIFFLLTFVLSILYARKANTPSNLSRRIEAEQTPVPRFHDTCPGRFDFAELGRNRNRDGQSGAVLGSRSFRDRDAYLARDDKPSAVFESFSNASNHSGDFAKSERRAFRLRFAEAVASGVSSRAALSVRDLTVAILVTQART